MLRFIQITSYSILLVAAAHAPYQLHTRLLVSHLAILPLKLLYLSPVVARVSRPGAMHRVRQSRIVPLSV